MKREREEAELAAQARGEVQLQHGFITCPAAPLTVSQSGAQGGGGGGRDLLSDRDWSREEVQLLVKAVALYPSGTSRR